MKRDKRRDNKYNKSNNFIAGITNVYVNVRGGCMWSSARMGYVVSWYGRVVVVGSWTFNEGSWHRSSCGDTARCLMWVSWGRLSRWMCAAGWLLWETEIGRVVECNWMFVAGSWGQSSRWMQLDDRSGKLRSVESLDAAGRL